PDDEYYGYGFISFEAFGIGVVSPDDYRTTTSIRLIACQRRKIKWTPAPARRRRPYNQALKSHLAQCEELLNNSNDLGNDSAREHGTPQSAHFHTPTESSHVSKWTTDGKLAENPNGNVTFMDNYLLGMVNDEKKSTTTPWIPSSRCQNLISFLMKKTGTSTAHAWPSPAVAFKLWQTFLDRLNPFTKVIHMPSLQPFVVEATNGPHCLSSNIMSLMLSIFLMAVNSMTEDECDNSLGIPKESATVTFSAATQQALRRLDFI
ncbi:hypothetical protein GCG54_00007998, partial [Colletotrichum gloeosporioides]